MDKQPDLMKPAELASEWQVAVKTLANMRSLGVGPPFAKINRSVRYSRKACARWLAEQSTQPQGAA